MRLVLKDSSVIQIVDSFGIGDLIAHYAEVSDVATDVEKCTEENCSAIKLISDSGEIMAEYTDMVFAGVTTAQSSEPGVGIEAHFHFRAKTAEERMMQMLVELQSRVGAIEESQAIQDGAIEDLAGNVSDMGETQDLMDGAITDLADAVSELTESNDLQDGAIEDLAEAVSDSGN